MALFLFPYSIYYSSSYTQHSLADVYATVNDVVAGQKQSDMQIFTENVP